jgi:hypothetical protein
MNSMSSSERDGRASRKLSDSPKGDRLPKSGSESEIWGMKVKA